jgi:predicted nucleic acid-binding protein
VILVDTSVWVDHLRAGDDGLVGLLEQGRVLTHPAVVGEVALGSLKRRAQVLGSLGELPQIHVATDAEVLHFIEEQALHGRGIGYVDAHLLAALRLTPGTSLWTRDQRLLAVAEELGLTVTGIR